MTETGQAGKWLKTADGSTARLLQLCLAYFVFYVITGITVKYFLGPSSEGYPGMAGLEFLVYSTAGGNLIAISVVIIGRWYRFESARRVQVGPWNLPSELAYIVPSGVCTAVVIPTTTLMYTLPISVMVAMVIMRGSVILISRAVDAIQIRQGILDKKVYFEENLGVVFAMAAVGVHLANAGGGDFDFVQNPMAMTILGAYLTAYAGRIYIMNYFKNTRPPGVSYDKKGFYAVEQITSLVVLGGVAAILVAVGGEAGTRIGTFAGAVTDPRPLWHWALIAGMAFGIVSFFSVFIFMFRGRTATFAGLVNRLTSLIAGTTATVLFAVFFRGKWPERNDWLSLGFIFIAVYFLTRAEKRRAREQGIPTS